MSETSVGKNLEVSAQCFLTFLNFSELKLDYKFYYADFYVKFSEKQSLKLNFISINTAFTFL